ncbi:MAG: hypothetical protein H6577_07960 [Lewinellaceae bacterium]|nr:hypothetical protein [Saprospiraceae bacterium]MCB9338049.1 hypothetical protein [Lewinellaceae bacterium]
MPYRTSAQFKLNSVFGLLLLIAFFVGLFFILKGVFWILSWIAPVLLVAAFIIDKSVIINYGKWIAKTLKENPLLGIAAIVFTVVGYMVVFPYLFAKALFKKKVKDVQQQYEREQQGELVDFEEIESKPNRKETLELPQFEKQAKQEKRSEYDQLFD